jgi:GDP-L-fucose synthase
LTALYPLEGKRVWIAGHRGMVGGALMRRLERENCELLTGPEEPIDLRRQAEIEAWMAEAQPQAVFLAAARVGGIQANNTRPAEFIYDNLMIEANVVEAAYRLGVEKLLMLGSSCIYPKFAPQPIREGDLMTGPLEPTNEWYALAKIAGVKLCQAYRHQYGCDFISAMPTNLYGTGDNFDLAAGHVVPALMSKARRARLEGDASLEVWGSGRPRRELLHVDDAADALVHLMTHYSDAPHINIGTGEDVTIRELAEAICRVVGFEGHLAFDASKPDGTPRKLLDVSALAAAGWRASIGLEEGLRRTYAWYQDALERGEVRA